MALITEYQGNPLAYIKVETVVADKMNGVRVMTNTWKNNGLRLVDAPCDYYEQFDFPFDATITGNFIEAAYGHLKTVFTTAQDA
jgi:glutathione peroxidase-family protein